MAKIPDQITVTLQADNQLAQKLTRLVTTTTTLHRRLRAAEARIADLEEALEARK